MKNFYPLEAFTCAIFSIFLYTGVINFPAYEGKTTVLEPYVTNNSPYIIFYKPESNVANPGLDPDGSYAILPGESLFTPVDAVVSPVFEGGKIYKTPTGGRLVINSNGMPEPANIIARSGLWFSHYGVVEPPCHNFANLANGRHVLYSVADLVVR